MRTTSNAYPTEAAARRAIEALRDSGVDDRDIRLLTGREPRDVRREPVGGFAGPAEPDAPVGTYGDGAVVRRQGAGSFAGDPDQQRQGSFADTDRITIVSYDGDAERTRVTGLRGARRLLSRAPLDDHAVDRAVNELQLGHTVVLVDLRGTTASQAQAQLEQQARRLGMRSSRPGRERRRPGMPAFEDVEVREAPLPQGAVRYRELGIGEPIVLVHGLLTNSLLWAGVASALARDFRVIAPDWPLGSHERPLRPGTDLSPPGLTNVIADFLGALELDDVTLVGNDTGGALCQLVAVHHPERVARLVLTPCDAYENFLPPIFRPLQLLARVPGAMWVIVNALRPRLAQRLPMTFGRLSKRPLGPHVARAFLRPAQRDRRVRCDLARILRAISSTYTLEAAERFGEVDKPVLIAWATDDRLFPFRYAQRMADAFPNARLERIEDSYTFVSVDQPERTADLIASFARIPLAA
jgi:pimeloyl-ACP methyl ester carboxylesterase